MCFALLYEINRTVLGVQMYAEKLPQLYLDSSLKACQALPAIRNKIEFSNIYSLNYKSDMVGYFKASLLLDMVNAFNVA